MEKEPSMDKCSPRRLFEGSENDLRELLDREAARFNTPAFIGADPVQFPRKFESLPDIEIVSLLASTVAWGNRKMICSNIDKMLSLMDWCPSAYLLDKGYEELPDMNIHRTFFARDLRAFLRGLYPIYRKHGSLQEFARTERVGDAEQPAWALAAAINASLEEANRGIADVNLSRCLPQNLKNTALKRLNMALRWLVRDDGIVDLGVWDVIKPSQLYIPLDVHVGDTSRELGLLSRNANDRRSVEELTATLRRFNPADPVIYDYALFSLGLPSNSPAASGLPR
ncbi:MAG: TIGR02757 family protein [Muribaculaceae bacterium]|nr:TIGR02757 family protein [Muribaculaceae bacterium]